MTSVRTLFFAALIGAVALTAAGVEVAPHDDGAEAHSTHAPGAYRSVLLALFDGGETQPPLGLAHDHDVHAWTAPVATAVTAVMAFGLIASLAGRAGLLRRIIPTQDLRAPALLPPR